MKDDVFNQYNNNYEIIINNNNNVYLNNDKVNMIYGYLKAINEFEEYFQKMDNEYVIKFSLCYLIKLVDYNNFKEKINYEFLLNIFLVKIIAKMKLMNILILIKLILIILQE